MQTKLITEHNKHIEERLLSLSCAECEPIIMEQLRRTRKIHIVGTKVKEV